MTQIGEEGKGQVAVWLIQVFRPYRDYRAAKSGKCWFKKVLSREAALREAGQLRDTGLLPGKDWRCIKVFEDPEDRKFYRRNGSPKKSEVWLDRPAGHVELDKRVVGMSYGFGGALNAQPVKSGWRRRR